MLQAIIRPTTRQPPTAACTLGQDVVLLLTQDGSARLLDLNGHFLALSATGAAMLVAALTTDERTAAERIAMVYDVETERIQGDLRTLLCQLAQAKVISRFGQPQHLDPRRRPGRIRVLRSTLRWLDALPLSERRRTGLLLTLAYWSLRWGGWPATVESWRASFPPSGGPASHHAPCRDPAVVQAVDHVVRDVAAAHCLPLECKERALVGWALLRRCGLPAQLVVGVDLYPFASHCWCQLHGVVIGDFAERCQRFTPVCIYD